MFGVLNEACYDLQEVFGVFNEACYDLQEVFGVLNEACYDLQEVFGVLNEACYDLQEVFVVLNEVCSDLPGSGWCVSRSLSCTKKDCIPQSLPLVNSLAFRIHTFADFPPEIQSQGQYLTVKAVTTLGGMDK